MRPSSSWTHWTTPSRGPWDMLANSHRPGPHQQIRPRLIPQFEKLDVEDPWSRISFACDKTSYPRVCAGLLYKMYPGLEAPCSVAPNRLRTEPLDERVKEDIVTAREHNIAIALLANLPTEILLMIETYADREAMMALRGTCSRLMHLIHDPTVGRANICEVEKWRRDYTSRRKKFQLWDLCERERAGDVEEELVCKYCLTTHPSTWFSSIQRRKRPEERGCIPWTAPLRLCQHRSITLRDIRFWNPGFWCGKIHSSTKSYLSDCLTPRTILQHGVWDRSSFIHSAGYEYIGTPRLGFGHGPVFGPEYGRDFISVTGGGRGVRLGVVGLNVDEEGRAVGRESLWGMTDLVAEDDEAKERKVVVRSEMVIMKMGMHEDVNGERVTKKILEIGRNGGLGMCPHLTPAVVSLLLAQEPYQDCPRLESHGMDTVPCNTSRPSFCSSSWRNSFSFSSPPAPSNSGCGARHHCPNKSCHTYFYFYHARYTSFEYAWKDELVLCVVRKLGECEDAWDKRWMVQLEDEIALHNTSDMPWSEDHIVGHEHITAYAKMIR